MEPKLDSWRENLTPAQEEPFWHYQKFRWLLFGLLYLIAFAIAFLASRALIPSLIFTGILALLVEFWVLANYLQARLKRQKVRK